MLETLGNGPALENHRNQTREPVFSLKLPDALYPALCWMERRGWLEAEWGESELGRRAKLYRLTRQGRAQLTAETAAWLKVVSGVSRILLAQ
jgi:hypothetical protein